MIWLLVDLIWQLLLHQLAVHAVFSVMCILLIFNHSKCQCTVLFYSGRYLLTIALKEQF